MFESLGTALQSAFRKLSGRGALTEKNIQEGLREVRMALLAADVHYAVVKDFVDRVAKRAVGQDVIRSVSPAQQVVKIVHDELVDLMGPVDPTIPVNPKGACVLVMVGLQGSGKTTTCAKLALLLKKRGRRPMLVAADLQRPAAIQQLQALGKQLDIPVYAEPPPASILGIAPPYKASKVCRHGVDVAERSGRDVVICDTAGRLHIDDALMKELEEVVGAVKPQQVYLVCDAMTGQDAVTSAKGFAGRLPLAGVILTKLDGDARGGAALSVKAVTGVPIKFVGIGEKPDQLEEFRPAGMADRILGMGDVVALVERAKEAVDVESALKLQEKLKRDGLDFQDFLDQLEKLQKMGPLKDLLGMIPGVGAHADKVDEKQLGRTKAIIQSMTRDERQNADLLDGSRRLRIAKGSGCSIQDVNTLLKQFKEMKRMMKTIKKKKGMFGGMMPGGMGMGQ
jgi:signal recognition particle subunit SRP54